MKVYYNVLKSITFVPNLLIIYFVACVFYIIFKI